jgi:hypothetical protein
VEAGICCVSGKGQAEEEEGVERKEEVWERVEAHSKGLWPYMMQRS